MEKHRILILDDQKAEAAFLKTLLEFHLFEVTTTYSTAEAIFEISTGRYQVFLTDHRMGGINGVRAFRDAMSQSSGTKFVLVAYRDLSEHELRELYDAHIVLFRKPFMPYEFVTRIESLFA